MFAAAQNRKLGANQRGPGRLTPLTAADDHPLFHDPATRSQPPACAPRHGTGSRIMKNRTLRALLAPPVFPGDDAKTLLARVLHYAILANVPLMALLFLAGRIGGRVPAIVSWLELGFAALLIPLHHWTRQGRVKLAGGVFLFAGFLVITATLARMGTIRAPATGFYVALIIAAGLFFERRGLVIMIGSSSLAVAALIGAENAGLLPRPDYTVSITQWLATSALFACLGFWTLAVIENIRSSLRRAETEGAARQRNEIRLRLALEAAQQSWFEVNLRTGAVVTSEDYARRLGHDPATFSSTLSNWLDHIHPDDRPALEETFRRCLANGQTLSAEYRRQTAAGGWLWIQSVGRVVEHDADGHPLLLCGTHTDISERKQAQIVANHLAAIVESSDDCIISKNLDSVITSWNRGAEAIFGYTAGEIVGTTIMRLIPTDRQHEEQAILGRIVQGESVQRLETERLRKDGRTISVSVTASPIRNGSGRIIGVSKVARDITERRRAEEALKSSLHDKEALLKEVHHRVKNNLQVIMSLLRLESRRSERAEARSVLSEMQGRVRSMAVLHEALYRTGTFAAVDLGAYLRQLATQSFNTLVTRPGAVRLHLDLDSVPVEMDRALPCGLLLNELLSNCLKHGFPNEQTGEVRVDLHRCEAGPHVRLRVSDTGVGLPADFEAIQDKSLGMKLVSDLTLQLDGTLEIGPGRAAIFSIKFTAAAPKFSAALAGI